MSYDYDELERMDRESGLRAADWSSVSEPSITSGPLDYKDDWPEPLIKVEPAVKTRKNLQIYKIDDTHIGITSGQVAGQVEDGTSIWSVSGSGQIWAQVDVAGDNSVSNLVIFNSLVTPTQDAVHAYVLLGSYYPVSGALTVLPLVGGSLWLEVCRSDPVTGIIWPNWSVV